MKLISSLLTFLIFALSIKPCSDGTNIEDQHIEVSSIEHNHQEDSDDSCPITCICDCCGMSIVYVPLTTFELIVYAKISTNLITTYQPIYRFDFQSNIWQPPRVIS